MSELEKIFLTSGLTIFGGVLVYIIGQIILKFFIDPIHEQRKLIGKIADSLIFYGNIYSNPGIPPKENMDEAAINFRQQAALLQSKTHIIPLYDMFAFLGLTTNRANLSKASSNLIGLSNSIHRSPPDGVKLRPDDRAEEIKRLLNLRIET